MFKLLDQIVNGVVFGPHERKVKKYLDEATQESILEDLKKALAPKLREVKGLWTIFDAYCVEEGYWNEDSLRRHLKATQPNAEPDVRTLWRCFHFYAYHPFAHNAVNGKVDAAAFQRAVSLLAMQGTDLLGTQDEGAYFWRQDAAFFRKADSARLLRSISVLGDESSKMSHCSGAMVEDTMDVLAMVLPHSIQQAPSPDQLTPIALKLLGGGGDLSTNTCQLSRKEASSLFCLLLRLRLHEGKWGSRFHLGTIDKVATGDENLAGALVDELIRFEGEESHDSLSDLLPNLHLRFHQLWAVIFQPSMAADDQISSQTLEPLISHALGAISLFIPQPNISSYPQVTIQDQRIVFEKINHASQDSNNMSSAHLMKCLTQDQNPHLVLVSDAGNETAPKTVAGAYFPGPLWPQEANNREEERQLKSGSHFLFQLQPQVRFLRWNSPSTPLAELINLPEQQLPEAIISSDNTSSQPSRPYRIGAPEMDGPGLSIDPLQKSATLRSQPLEPSGTQKVWYDDVRCHVDSRTSATEMWEVDIKLGRMDIFSVSGGTNVSPVIKSQPGANDRALHVYNQDAAEPKIGGEDLTKRIQGFGSSQ